MSEKLVAFTIGVKEKPTNAAVTVPAKKGRYVCGRQANKISLLYMFIVL